jgi:uncharacterized small protein (DUF1192 family)
MAGDWIKMRCNLDTDPSVFQMAAALQMDELAVVGRLWKVWAWADQHCADCNAVSVTTNVLDRITSTPGFAEAMRKVGWLEGREGALSFPHFDRHNGQTAKKRALTKNRVEKTRADSVTLPALQERYQRREEKRYKTPPRAREADGEVGEVPEAVILPTLQTVLAFAQHAGVPADVAETWYHETEGRPYAPDGSWTDKSGRPIARWESALKAYASKWAANDAQRASRPAGARSSAPGRAPSVWELQQRIEAAQKEIDRISANPSNKEQVPDSFDRRLKAEPMEQVKTLKARIVEMRRELAGVERKEAA